MVLTRFGLSRSPPWACLVPRIKLLTVAWVRPTRPAIALRRMPSRASASTSCLIPIWVGRGIIRTIRENWEKICNHWFQLSTVRRQIWRNDHLSCGFGLRQSHLALKWKSSQGKVEIRWGVVTGQFQPTGSTKFDPYRFYCLTWGCNNLFFFQECTMQTLPIAANSIFKILAWLSNGHWIIIDTLILQRSTYGICYI